MGADSSLLELFLSGLPATYRCPAETARSLAEVLSSKLEVTLSRAPELSYSLGEFVKELAGEVPGDTAPDEYLRSLNLSDLYLARACGRGDAAAIAVFEATYFEDIARVLSEANVFPDLIAEAQQILRERFFVPKDGRAPMIATYSGRGSLRGWARISALREVYRFAAERKRWEPLDDEELARVPALGDDPELLLVKESCRREFKAAFTEGLKALSSRERNLLRHYYLDGLGIDQIGDLYQVHRATAARWVARARQSILLQTRHALVSRLAIDSAEFDGILRLIESQVEISLRILLQTVEST